MNFIKTLRAKLFLSGLLTIVLGVVLLIYPKSVLSTIAKIIGVIILLNGLTDFIGMYAGKRTKAPSTGRLVIVVIKCIFGIYMITSASHILSFFSMIFSLVILVFAVNGMSHALQLKYANVPGWQFSVTVNGVILAAGILLVFLPFGAISITARIIGILLIMHGVNEWVTLTRTRQMSSEQYGAMRDFKDEMDGNIIDMDDYK